MGSKKDSCGHFLELFISIVLGILYVHNIFTWFSYIVSSKKFHIFIWVQFVIHTALYFDGTLWLSIALLLSVCSKHGCCVVHGIVNNCSNPEFEKQGSTKNFFTIRELNSFHHILYFFGFHPKEIVNLKCWWHIMFLRLGLCVLDFHSWEKLTQK